uniref:CHAT domain-containing protein n=1 Tax=Chloroflexus sp. TaxID=1904827 RepID=UPI002ACEF180
AVVGSLWSINDLSTALLMHRFYELHLTGDLNAGLGPQPPARALRLAQVWLRDLTYGAMFDYLERHRQLRATQRLLADGGATAPARIPFDFIATGRAIAEEGMLDDPSHRPYASPIYWAAFTFNGALAGG